MQHSCVEVEKGSEFFMVALAATPLGGSNMAFHRELWDVVRDEVCRTEVSIHDVPGRRTA